MSAGTQRGRPVRAETGRGRPAPWQAAALERLAAAGAGASFDAATAVAGGVTVDLREGAGDLRGGGGARLLLRDADGNPPGSIGAHAFARGEAAVECRLLRLEGGRVEVREQGEVPLDLLRYASCRERVLRATAPWFARALLAEAAPPRGQGSPPLALPAPPPSKAALASAEALRLFQRLRSEALEEHWAVGVLDGPPGALLKGFDASKVRWIDSPAGGFLADPFGLEHPAGRVTVLAEAYGFRERLGHLVAFEVDPASPDLAQAARSPRPALREPYHLSYPQLLRLNGEVFLLPETWEARRVQLRRAANFPGEWAEGLTLLENRAAVDATLHRQDGPDGGRWWLFFSDMDDEPQLKLFAVHAERLEGPWTPHPLNPVKTDARSARPAGPLFEHEGRLYRPAQDCTRTYGGALTINRVDALTPTAYAETVVATLAPDPHGPYPHGLHTLCGVELSGGGWITLIDGKRHRTSPRRFFATAAAVAKKRLKRRGR